MLFKRVLLLAIIVTGIACYFLFDLQRVASVDFFQNLYQQQPLLTAGIYFLVYVLATALSLPVGALLSLAGGAVFGLTAGVVLVSFASTIGATLAFLISRTLLREWVQEKFAHHMQAINRGIEKDGAFYLFSLRLIPIFPFWLINLSMGLTSLRVPTYFWISQLGMLPATLVYVNAGAELAAITELSPAGILTPGLLLSFILLASLPFFAKAVVGLSKRWQVYRPYQKPQQFDANLLVIGGGSAGLVTALIGAAVKAKVILVEKGKMGGDCLNTGCVPSKALIKAARSVADIRKAHELGIDVDEPHVDFPRVMSRVQQVVDTIAPHDSVERFTDLGVECLAGEARLLSPWQVQIGERTISAKNIVIASGAEPFVPPIPGINEVDYLTSDNLWELRDQPSSLLILGAGPIGCELAQAFQRLGTQVTLVDMMSNILPREDTDVADLVRQRLEQEGVEILLNHKTVGFEQQHGTDIALLEALADSSADESLAGGQHKAQRKLAFNKLLVAVGRKAKTDGLGLQALGIEITAQGTLAVDKHLRTRFANIYACGDVTGPYQFTHTAAHQAWYAAVNALFGSFKKFAVDYRVIPWTTFTDPEIARVGISEADAKEQGIAYEVVRYPLSELDRAIADNTTEGFVKVLTAPGKDRILGATIVGSHAGELLTEFVTAMKRNMGLNKILGTIHAYPTLSEANKMAAGIWKRGHAPKKLLTYVEKYHYWRLRRKS
ncbi:MAG: pyridine nucleotide-disulfide oxidoreductase [Gammaproteobacteria bacterium]|nr:MAG: pyridine nucleotide-disulfide oxidoreductase [Gammaproteobacteria bacterium]